MVQGAQLGPVRHWPAAESGDKAIDNDKIEAQSHVSKLYTCMYKSQCLVMASSKTSTWSSL